MILPPSRLGRTDKAWEWGLALKETTFLEAVTVPCSCHDGPS